MAEPFLFVIGAGTAGNACGRQVARAGHRVVAAEADRVGGTCLWRGCMPKKALYNAASAMRHASRMPQFGIDTGDVAADWQAILGWKWHAQETYAGDQEAIATEAGIEILKDAASFLDPDTVYCSGQEFRPDHIVISTGSEPLIPEIPGVELADTSDDALSYHDLPTSMAIVGSGFIAFEFAGVFASLGTKVTILGRSEESLRGFDPEIAQIAKDGLTGLGVEFLSGVSTRALSGSPGSIQVEYEHAGGATDTLTVERVLLAIGRRPATGDLGLEAAGIDTDEQGRVVTDGLNTSNPRVWIAGDAAGGPQFTPIASSHGSAIAQSLLSGDDLEPDVAAIPAAVFTVPQLAAVGLTEEQAEQAGLDFEVHRTTFEYVGAAIVADERVGLIKLLVAPDGLILGAHIAHAHASDLIYPYALAIRTGATAADIAATRAVHPAFSEAVNWAAW